MRSAARVLAIGLLLTPRGALTAEGTAAGDFLVAAGGTHEGGPTVEYDSGNDRFLVAWSDYRNKDESGFDIYGRIIDAQGRPVGGDVPISRAAKGQSFPAMAFDPDGGSFLVVWTDWRNAVATDSDIYGRIVGADGSLRGGDIQITSLRTSQKFPAVAFDPKHRRYLVLWADEREGVGPKIYGRFVDGDGALVGEEFRLSPEGGQQDGPAVMYDSKRGRFFAVWRDDQPNGIFARLVETDTGPRGPRIAATVEEARVLPPTLDAVAFAADADRILIAWTSRKDEPARGMDAYAVLLDGTDGRPQGGPYLVAAAKNHQRYAVAGYDSFNRRFLIGWYDLRRSIGATNIDIYGRYLSLDGNLSTEFLVSNPGVQGVRRYPAIAYSTKSVVFLVVWEDWRGAGGQRRQIFGRIP